MRRAVTGLLATACLLTMGAQAASAVGWRPAETVPGSLVASQWGVSVVSDAAGDLAAAWPSPPPPTYDWRAASAARPAGASWSAQAVMPGTADGGAAAIADNAAGDVLQVYSEFDAATSSDQLSAVQSEPGSAPTTTKVNVPVGGVGVDVTSAAIDGAGDAVVAWESSTAYSDFQLQVATRTGLHGTWTVRTYLSGGREPVVTMDEKGDAALVYSVVQGGNFVVYGAYRPAGQAGFGTGLELSSASENANAVEKVAIGARGDVLASWSGSGLARVRYRSASTGAWQPVQQFPANAIGPAVAVGDDGSAVAVWEQTDGSGHAALWGSALDPSGRWSAQAAWWTGSGDGVTLPPAVALDHAGTATVAFAADDGGGDVSSMLALRRGGNGTLSPPVELGSGDLAAGSIPSIATDARGDAIVAWPSRTTGAAESAAYVAAPPTIAAVSVPSGATAGVAAALSASVSDPFAAPLALHWDFGDGTSGDGASVTHAWRAPGSYTVTLTVADATGATATAQRAVSVMGAPGGGVGPGPTGDSPQPTPAAKPGDRTKPSLTLAQPTCPKHATAKTCRRYRVTARAWRTFAGTVKDASGVRSLTATLTSGKGKRCRVLVAGGKLRAAACTKAKPVTVKLGRRGGYKLTVKALTKGTWTLTLRATDRAGNVTTLHRTLRLA